MTRKIGLHYEEHLCILGCMHMSNIGQGGQYALYAGVEESGEEASYLGLEKSHPGLNVSRFRHKETGMTWFPLQVDVLGNIKTRTP